jgi:hypothetical protein
MRRRSVVMLGVVLLVTSLAAQAAQETVNVVVTNPGSPRYVALDPGVDIVIVRHGWVVFDLDSYKSIRDLVKHPPIFFALAAYDEAGIPIRVSRAKFDCIPMAGPAGETIWRVTWEYEIKVKQLSSGTYALVGTWTSSAGTVSTYLPTYITIP